jgi:hypothetical protein
VAVLKKKSAVYDRLNDFDELRGRRHLCDKEKDQAASLLQQNFFCWQKQG